MESTIGSDRFGSDRGESTESVDHHRERIRGDSFIGINVICVIGGIASPPPLRFRWNAEKEGVGGGGVF